MVTRAVNVQLRADISNFQRGLAQAAVATKAFSSSLNTADSRMGTLVQSAVALGPALVPIAAQAVPALAGLTAQLGAAVGAAGVAALAFGGMGDALGAVSDYKLEPTAANLAKMRQEMAGFGPAGQEFIGFINGLTPELQTLRTAAQEGLLPGAQEGIEELLILLPQVERTVADIADTMGGLLAEAGDNLNEGAWLEFFDYIDREARPTLDAMFRTVGNLAEGFAQMMMAFDPLADDFTGGFLEMSRSFNEWAAGLSGSNGFQEFVDYIRDTGPQVRETLGAIGGAFVAFAQAAAPVADIVLPLLEAMADGFSALASSPAGPILIGVAAGINAVALAMKLATAANASSLVTALGKIGPVGASASAGLGMIGPAATKASAGARLGAVGIGALALSMTDLDEKAGLSNAATFAMLGALAGPWGIAAGAAAGAIKDAASANDTFTDSLERAQDALADSGASFDEQANAVRLARENFEEFQSGVESSGVGETIANWFDPAAYKNTFEGIFGKSDVEESEDALAALSSQLDATAQAEERLASTVEEQTQQFRDNIAAMRARRQEALAGENAEIAYEASIDEARRSLQENGKTLDITTEKGRNNRSALLNMASAWNSQDDAAKNAQGAHRQAIGTFVDMAVRMGMSAGAARDYARRLMEIPANRKTTIQLETAVARGQLESFIRDSSGRTISIGTRIVASSAGIPGGLVARATGGPIEGPGTATSDSILARLSDGEHVLTAAEVDKMGGHAGVYAFRKMVAAGRMLPGFAGGGSLAGYSAGKKYDPITRSDLRDFNLGGGMSARDVRNEFREFARIMREAGMEVGKGFDNIADRSVRLTARWNKLERAADKASDRLGDLRSDRASLVQGAGGYFDNDPFSNGGLEATMLQLNADTNDSRKRERLLRRARRLGVKSRDAFSFLAEEGDQSTLQQIDTRREARAFQQAFAARERAQGSLGSFAGGAAYGKEIGKLSRSLDRFDRNQKQIVKAMNGLEKRVEAGSFRGTKAGNDARSKRGSITRRAGRG